MIINYKKRFDEIRHEENGIEFWYARCCKTYSI